MADKRAFAVFDVGYLDNPKIIEILDESTEAVMMHAYSVLYSSQHLTDGHVPVKRMTKHIGGTQDDVELLVNAGLWHQEGHDCEECPQPSGSRVYVHNYLEHNREKASTLKLSEKGREAAAKRWGTQCETDAEPNAKPNGYPNAHPIGVPNAQTDRQTETNKSTGSAKRTRLSDTFTPTDTHTKKAAELNVDIQGELEAFKDHFIGKGELKADWNRAFHTWLRNTEKFGPNAPRPSTSTSSSYIWG